MMRETRTLKGLFPDPKPPRRKNFIKENVKSLRRMEQLFHTNNQSAKDLKLPILRSSKTSSKDTRTIDNRTPNNEDIKELKAEKIIENGISNLLNQKSFYKDQNDRKKSAPLPSNKKNVVKKTSRSLANGNVTRKSHYCRHKIEHANENLEKLKVHSDIDFTCEKINKNINNDEISTKCKNQGVQTLDSEDIDSLYSEGVIRYPSGRAKEIQKPKSSDRGDTVEATDCNELENKNNSSDLQNDCIDNTKSNKEHTSLASKLVSQLNHNMPPPSYRVGVVPKYIKERKEALQKEKLAKTVTKHTDCPSGHIPLPDNERKETLSMLKKNYQEYINELNMLPIRTDTLRSQKRKMEIEKQLSKLEEAIKVFSRPKVFVKVDS